MEEYFKFKHSTIIKTQNSQNSECGHVMDSHLNFKKIGEVRIPLLYCSECRAEGKECKLTKILKIF
jgi:hypothetical protein